MPSHSNSRHSHRESHRSALHHSRSSHDARSRSPHRHDDSHRKRKRSPLPPALPFRAPQLTRHDYTIYKPLFASYLDIQKEIYLDEIEEQEARGRFKSFVGKWNRAELAEGWYDPAMLKKTQDAAASTSDAPNAVSRSPKRPGRDSPDRRPCNTAHEAGDGKNDSSSDDEIGPAPPDAHDRRAGPVIPRVEDLDLRDEMTAEDQQHHISALRYERKADRNAQKERLEELAPRADPGSRERALEKKREVTGTLNAFKEAKSPGAEEVPDSDLMGDDGIDGYKKRKREGERKKNEREIRKEEIMRARAAEREERVSELRAKEDKTMEMLRAIARERFG